MREAFGNTASLASLVYWISITMKIKTFSLLNIHKIIHNACIFLNITTNVGNLFLFVLSFNDYFEYKEHYDYMIMTNKESIASDEKKNN